MKYNTLITSIGSAGSQCYIKSLLNDERFNIVGTDMSKQNAYKNKVHSFYVVPAGDSEEYLSKIYDICNKEKIDLILPVMEGEIKNIVDHKKKFINEGTKVLSSDAKIIDIFQDKDKTAKFFLENNLKCPKMYNELEFQIPLIIKPKQGSGSRGIKICREKKDYYEFVKDAKIEEYVIQEYVEGEEISVDCFCDKSGSPKAIIPRKRIDIRNGLCFKSETFEDKNLVELVKTFLSKTKILGPCNIQAIKKDNEYYFFELNARIGGTYIHSVNAGIPLKEYILDFVKDKESMMMKSYKKIGMIRYLEEEYYEE